MLKGKRLAQAVVLSESVPACEVDQKQFVHAKDSGKAFSSDSWVCVLLQLVLLCYLAESGRLVIGGLQKRLQDALGAGRQQDDVMGSSSACRPVPLQCFPTPSSLSTRCCHSPVSFLK